MNINVLDTLNRYFTSEEVSSFIGLSEEYLKGIFKILLSLKEENIKLPRIKDIINKYIESDFNENIVNILVDDYIFEKRNINELLSMVNKYIESEYDERIYNFIIDRKLLNSEYNLQIKEIDKILFDYYKDLSDKYIHAYYIDTYKTQKEINRLAKKYIESDFNDTVLDIIEDEDVLSSRATTEIISLINTYLKYEDEDNLTNNSALYRIITSKPLLEERNNDEHINLIDIYVKSDFDNKVFESITDEKNIKGKTINEQINKINSIQNKDVVISISEYLRKNGDTKNLVNILKQNSISRFDPNTKIRVSNSMIA